jgi:acetyl-CoA synthetase
MRRWGCSDIAELHRRSVREPEWFWPEACADLGVTFSTPPQGVADESGGREFPRWFPGARINVADSCVFQHAAAPYADKPAVVYESDRGDREELSYRQLGAQVERFAASLRGLGVAKGDRVALFMPPMPEAAVAFMACAKIGAIAVPAFSGYGADALAARLRDADIGTLITVDATTRRGRPVPMKATADAALASAPSVLRVVVVRCTGEPVDMRPDRDIYWDDLDPGTAQVPTVQLDANDPLVIIYTSGTTGRPKGIVHSHAGFLVKAALDFGYGFEIAREDTLAWTADLGWMLGPLLLLGILHFGATLVLIEGVPDYPARDRLWQIAQRNHATVLGIAPTAARGQKALDDQYAMQIDLPDVRAFASTGEPWDELTWEWLFERVGRAAAPIINYSGGTEVGGGILVAYPTLPQQPAAFSGPLIGMDVAVDAGDAGPGAVGELVVLNTWPGMTHSFWHDDERYLDTYWRAHPGVWTHGDLVSVDADGFWIVHGRSDDTIKLAGRRIGPAEIESALVAHPDVVEAAVIGVPDPMRGQRAVAFVVLGRAPAPGFDDQARAVVAEHAGRSLIPSEIHIVAELPKTKNGKIMRRAIRARFLHEPVGDLSALDNQRSLDLLPTADAGSDPSPAHRP